MTEIVLDEDPGARIRGYIQYRVEQQFGIKNASTFDTLIHIAFSQLAHLNGILDVHGNPITPARPSDIIAAAGKLLQYSEQPMAAIVDNSAKRGPDIEVRVMGVCRIGEAENADWEEIDDVTGTDTKRLEASTTPGESVELPDDGWEEGMRSVAQESRQGLGRS
jgi:hypothetical protein